jgi:dihydropyrimidinase
MNLLIKNGTIVTPEGMARRDLRVENEKITAVEENIPEKGGPSYDEIIDASGKYILPGIIDAHTHYHLESRGTVTADGFFSGSRAAAFGGVTTAIDFADQLPGKSLAQASLERAETGEAEMVVDFALHQCIFNTSEGIERELEELRSVGVTTVKIFTTYKREGYFIGERGLKHLFAACRERDLMVTAHCEDDDVIDRVSSQYEGRAHPPELHPILRPPEAEYAAIKMIGDLTRAAASPVYVVHLSSERGLDAVRELRDIGTRVVVETCPHYLLLTSELLKGKEAQKFIMTPPLRTGRDNEALWKAVEQGEIDIIATDHCSFTREQKMRSDDCRTVLPGIPGTEELLPLVHNAGVVEKRIDLRRMVSLLSEAPARYFGLYPQKGSLEPGTDADIVIFDPEKKHTITNESQHTAAGYTPYHGTRVSGMPVMTILRGSVIVRDGEFLGRKGQGRFLKAGPSSLF